MLHVLRRLLSFIALGAVLGDLIAMWIAPSVITWFISLPAASSLCKCVETATRTAEALIRWQLIGAGTGALVGAVVGELSTRSFLAWKQRRAAATPAPAAGPDPAPTADASPAHSAEPAPGADKPS